LIQELLQRGDENLLSRIVGTHAERGARELEPPAKHLVVTRLVERLLRGEVHAVEARGEARQRTRDS
jgi:hypothetical protein